MRPPVRLALKSAAWLSCLASLACSGPRPVLAATANAMGPLEIPAHTASADILKSLSEIKGDVYTSKCWTDKEGESCVVVWGKGNRPESDRSEMYAAKFHK
jgi:hypothetical protein